MKYFLYFITKLFPKVSLVQEVPFKLKISHEMPYVDSCNSVIEIFVLTYSYYSFMHWLKVVYFSDSILRKMLSLK